MLREYDNFRSEIQGNKREFFNEKDFGFMHINISCSRYIFQQLNSLNIADKYRK